MSARVSSGLQQPAVTFCPKYHIKFLVMINWFPFVFPTFYGELEIVIETVWMRIFPCNDPGLGGSYVNIFGTVELNSTVNVKIFRPRCAMLISLFI